MSEAGHLAFGQPIDGIVQFAYTVEDIDRAMPIYTELLGVGPWFKRGPVVAETALYRGEPTELELTLARGFTGHSMVELIEQHNDAPSVFLESIARSGYGFHHWGVGVAEIAPAVARFTAKGYEVVLADRLPTGGEVRYLDTTKDLAGMVELIEMNPGQERHYTSFHAASLAWDGEDPVRIG
ncbi:MAG: VOC family protein [Actinobacteria bacterium]|nr:VOC family protein [Actinomycetota bacterium]